MRSHDDSSLIVVVRAQRRSDPSQLSPLHFEAPRVYHNANYTSPQFVHSRDVCLFARIVCLLASHSLRFV